MDQDSIYSGLPQEEDRVFEPSLRPGTLAEFVGQEKLVGNLKTWIQAAKNRGQSLDHVLLSGPPGLGKTTLAFVLAGEMAVNIRPTSGPTLNKPRDLVGILTNLQHGDILFIDEIHRLDARVEEYLYTAIEDFRISIIIDPGPHSRAITLPLKHFTLIGATTRLGLLTPPLRARFQIIERLDFYPPEELKTVILNSAANLGLQIHDAAADLLAASARGTPRVANRFLRRVRDVAHAWESDTITEEIVADGMRRLGVDQGGLCELDRKILRAIAQSGGRPAGLKTIAAFVSEQEDTIEDVHEPFLIRLGLLEKTARGRMLTPQGWQCLGIAPGGPAQESLF